MDETTTFLLWFFGILFGIFLLIYNTWKSFLALMALNANLPALKNSTGSARDFGYLMLFEGAVYDFLLNVVVGTIAFAEPPQEWLFTVRCERHLTDPPDSLSWHRADWFCKNWLDPYQIGGHCRRKSPL
jgi:hypothetical protein